MAQSQSDASILCGHLALVSLVHDKLIKSPTGEVYPYLRLVGGGMPQKKGS